MIKYILRRVLSMVLTLLAVSMLTFFVIQLPEGDVLTHKMAKAIATGNSASVAQIEVERKRFGLDQPMYVLYSRWIGLQWFLPSKGFDAASDNADSRQFFRPEYRGVMQGNLGHSFTEKKPGTPMIVERMPLTLLIAFGALIVAYGLGIPAGIYSACKQYSPGDYFVMSVSFLGMSIPAFLLALVAMYILFKYYGISPGGMHSAKFINAPVSWAWFVDFLQHLIAPLIVVAVNGTASLLRVMRANMLDQLSQLYVTTARAKGVSEWVMLWRYPARVAIIPLVSSFGFILAGLIGGQAIIAMVLGLPTIGNLLLSSLLSQDMYIAGSIVMIQTVLVVVGMFLSDVFLGLIDPRIRMTGGAK